MQLTEHGLFRTFAPVNATLWKLPTVGADALAPENLVFLVEQNDADVRPKAFTVSIINLKLLNCVHYARRTAAGSWMFP